MSLLFTNNAVSTLAAGIGSGDLSLTVQAADGNLFPNPTGNDSFLITLQDASNNIEICECTSRSGDALTIVRAQEGTTALAFLSGDSVELRITAGVLSQYRQGVGDAVTDTGVNKSVGLSDVHDFINCTAAVTCTLADASTMGEGYQVTIKNESAGQVLVNRANTADTINNVLQNVTIEPGGSIYLAVNQNEDGYITMYESFQNAFPVGSLYFNDSDSTNPGTLLGFGTWVAIPGRFRIGVGDNGDGKKYAAQEEGGSKDAVVVQHNHGITDPGHTHNTRSGANGNGSGGYDDANYGFNTATFSSTTGITIDNEGESGTDKNLPPYRAVYIWRRTV